jgi:hypothetical protein
MALDSASPVHVTEPRRPSTWRRPGLWLILLMSFGLVAWVGYVVGDQQATVHTDTVRAYVGLNVTSFHLHGEADGFTLSTVTWTDSDGSLHEPGDIPSCLTRVGNATIRLSWVPVSDPDGTSWRNFFYVDCRATHYVS